MRKMYELPSDGCYFLNEDEIISISSEADQGGYGEDI